MKSTHIEQTNTDYNWYKYYNRLMPVNQFGRLNVDKEAEDMELNIVPAWMDDTDEELGKCLFLECGEMGSAISWTEGTDGQGTSTGGQSGGVFGRGRNNEYGSGSVGSDDIDYNGGALAQSRAGKKQTVGQTAVSCGGFIGNNGRLQFHNDSLFHAVERADRWGKVYL